MSCYRTVRRFERDEGGDATYVLVTGSDNGDNTSVGQSRNGVVDSSRE